LHRYSDELFCVVRYDLLTHEDLAIRRIIHCIIA
jgi:hypothetical protein